MVPLYTRGRGGLVVYTSESGSRGRRFEPHSGRRVVSLSKTYLPPPPPPKKKVLVKPRKRWQRPNMTEKLFNGTLSVKPNQKPYIQLKIEVKILNNSIYHNNSDFFKKKTKITFCKCLKCTVSGVILVT